MSWFCSHLPKIKINLKYLPLGVENQTKKAELSIYVYIYMWKYRISIRMLTHCYSPIVKLKYNLLYQCDEIPSNPFTISKIYDWRTTKNPQVSAQKYRTSSLDICLICPVIIFEYSQEARKSLLREEFGKASQKCIMRNDVKALSWQWLW